MNLLRTARLTLEPQLGVHADEMFAVLADPAIYRYENDPPESVEWLRERFARLEARASPNGRERWLNWVIRAADQRLIGFVQATVTTTRADGADAAVAYILASEHWGRGLASEATAAVLDELASCYRVSRFHAVLKRGNHRSLRLLGRLGFGLAPADLPSPQEVAVDEIHMWLPRTPPAATG